jgi:hypothetical protein
VLIIIKGGNKVNIGDHVIEIEEPIKGVDRIMITGNFPKKLLILDEKGMQEYLLIRSRKGGFLLNK